MYTCRPLKDHKTTILVQDGYDCVKNGFGDISLVPIYKHRETQWQPVACGYFNRANDPMCPEECPAKYNEQKKAFGDSEV